MGDFKDVPVIEVLVKPGDAVKKDDSLVTLESDKATMEVPSPTSGKVKDVRVKVGDKVSQGSAILTLEGAGAAPSGTGSDAQAKPAPAPAAAKTPAPARAMQAKAAPAPAPAPAKSAAPPPPAPAPAALAPADEARSVAHASPGVRRFARELGVDVSRVQGSGPK